MNDIKYNSRVFALQKIFLFALMIWGIVTPPSPCMAQEGEQLSPPWVDYLPIVVGTQWIYRDSENNYQRRIVERIHKVNLPELELKDIPFAQITVYTGSKQELAEEKFSPKDMDKDVHQVEEQFILLTPEGFLRAGQLGDDGEEFFPNALFILKDPKQKTWGGMASGSKLQFQMDGVQKLKVLSGNFDDCLKITYQIGLETDGKGRLFYCKGVGETKVEESGFQLELVRIIPSKQRNAPLLKMASFSPENMRWIHENLTKEIAVVPDMALMSPPGKTQSWMQRGGLWLIFALVILIILLGVIFYQKRTRSSLVVIDPEVLKQELSLGIAERNQGNYEEAQKRLEALIPHCPRNADLFFHLGQVFEGIQEPEKAKECFVKAVRIQPKFIEAHCHLGKLFRQQANYKEAYESYRIVLGIHPDFADIHNEAGEILRELGDEPKAREHFEQALALNPHFDRARRNLQVGPGTP